MSDRIKNAVLEKLSSIYDEENGQDVVSLGLISGLVVKDGHVGFAIEVAAEKGAEKEPLRKACESAVYDVPGVLSVTAVLTAHTGAAAQSNQSQRTPQEARPRSLDLPGIKKIVAVASGKGGVGKSTVAVNLAIALKSLGLSVGILDADVYGPSLPRMLGLQGKPESTGKKLLPKDAWGLKAMSIGLMVDEDRAMIWRGPMVMSALTQMLRDVEWGDLDILVVDMPPGTGDAQLTMAQHVPLAGAVIVSTPQEIALIDARKGITMFEKTQIPILGIIENMAYFENAGERTYIFGQGGAQRTAETLGCAFLGEIPIYVRLRETSDEGTPITATDPTAPESLAFAEIAANMLAALEEKGNRPAPRIRILD